MSGIPMMKVQHLVDMAPPTYLFGSTVHAAMAGTPISTYRADALLGTSGTATTSNFNIQSSTPLGNMPTPKVG